MFFIENIILTRYEHRFSGSGSGNSLAIAESSKLNRLITLLGQQSSFELSKICLINNDVDEIILVYLVAFHAQISLPVSYSLIPIIFEFIRIVLIY